MDQSNRYADLALREEDLMAGGRHVLCAYIMKPKAGFGNYLETAAHFAAESSTGTNVKVSTTDDFTRGVDALVYEKVPQEAENSINRYSRGSRSDPGRWPVNWNRTFELRRKEPRAGVLLLQRQHLAHRCIRCRVCKSVPVRLVL